MIEEIVFYCKRWYYRTDGLVIPCVVEDKTGLENMRIALLILVILARPCASFGAQGYNFVAHVQGMSVNDWIFGSLSIDGQNRTLSVDYRMPVYKGMADSAIWSTHLAANEDEIHIIRPFQSIDRTLSYKDDQHEGMEGLPPRILDLLHLLPTDLTPSDAVASEHRNGDRSFWIETDHLRVRLTLSDVEPLDAHGARLFATARSFPSLKDVGAGLSQDYVNELEAILDSPLDQTGRWSFDSHFAGYILFLDSLHQNDLIRLQRYYGHWRARTDERPSLVKHVLEEQFFHYFLGILPSEGEIPALSETTRAWVIEEFSQWLIHRFKDADLVKEYLLRMRFNGYDSLAYALSKEARVAIDIIPTSERDPEIRLRRLFEQFVNPHDPELRPEIEALVRDTLPRIREFAGQPEQTSDAIAGLEKVLVENDRFVNPVTLIDLKSIDYILAGLKLSSTHRDAGPTKQHFIDVLVEMRNSADEALLRMGDVYSESDGAAYRQAWVTAMNAVERYAENPCIPGLKVKISPRGISHLKEEAGKLVLPESLADSTPRILGPEGPQSIFQMLYLQSLREGPGVKLFRRQRLRVVILRNHLVVDVFESLAEER